MSEHNVHTAIVEDSFTIAQRLPQIPPDFKQVLQHDLDFARQGQHHPLQATSSPLLCWRNTKEFGQPVTS